MTTVQYNSNITVDTSAKYIIDNGTRHPFPVAAQSSTIQQYNLVSFQSPVLSPVSHRLLVEYRVDNLNGSAPLVLDYFIIRNLTSPPFTTSPPNTTSLSNTTSTTRLSKGAIAGVVIGALVGLALNGYLQGHVCGSNLIRVDCLCHGSNMTRFPER